MSQGRVQDVSWASRGRTDSDASTNESITPLPHLQPRMASASPALPDLYSEAVAPVTDAAPPNRNG